MLSFVAITPHPPIIVPEVGGSESKKCAKTIAAMELLSQKIAENKPSTIIIISPHAQLHSDRFAVYASPKFFGSLDQFGAPEVNFNFKGDEFLAQKIVEKSEKNGIKAFAFGDPQSDFFELDHGIMVPIYYLTKNLPASTRILPIAFSYLDRLEHFAFGQTIFEVCASKDLIGEKIALIASGDLSHRLTHGAPAEFSQVGKWFDEMIVQSIKNKDTQEIMGIDEDIIEQAGECGYRSIIIALGVLDKLKYQPEILSYEGPFGVGYLVANFLGV